MTKITTHVTDAKNRLLQQYKGKPGIESIIAALGNQVQTIEDVLDDLLTKRSIDTGEGVQLDGIGTIINLPRPSGMSDADYQIRLNAQILTLNSNGEPEVLIQLFALLTGATNIDYREKYPCAHRFFSEIELSSDLVDALFDALETAAVGGTRVVAIGKFVLDDTFIFSGGKGFGDIGDITKGGGFAKLYPIKKTFRFGDLNSPVQHDGGFGDQFDSASGGRFT